MKVVKRRNKAGQALIMVTVTLSVMLGMLSLAVDLGWGYYRHDAAQAAADAGTSAAIKAALYNSPSSQTCGSNNIWCGSTAGTITTCPSTAPVSPVTTFDYACRLAADNGFLPTSSRTVTVQANTTTTAPTVPGTVVSYWVTMRISESVTAFFGAPFFNSSGNAGPLTSSAISTAGITTTSSGSAPACMYLLGTSGTTLNISNGVSVTTSSCGVYDNSSSSSAVSVIGGAKLTSSNLNMVTGSTLSTNNGGCVDTPAGSCNSLTPTYGAAVADPFASLPSPTVTACSGGNYTSWQATPYSLAAGSYCGMTIGNGMGANLTGGTYIINGGTFSIAGGSTVTASAGVMIYLTNGATVSISNGATVTLSAQSTGSYQGILFYQDRTMSSPGGSSFQGGATMHLTGALYFPYSALTFDNGSNAQTDAIVANSVTFAGGATLNNGTKSQTGLGTTSVSSASMIQ